MTTREQYKLAYSMLRETTWDYVTFKIVTDGLGIDQPARIAALQSYSQSRWTDEIGESYRNKVLQKIIHNHLTADVNLLRWNQQFGKR